MALDIIKAETISILESPFLISEYVQDKFLIVFKIKVSQILMMSYYVLGQKDLTYILAKGGY
ncbi:hypothetical protein Thert_00612 [Thermoanaerobacterium thermosaccharolyticum]|uniref:Uncharacterized protein n=1 Tax=Thermoanaerobacterium thermosaccharolyticum TaxID=1517 RepID=A0A223HWD8_THETR|nr:hypothetical protein Thert_00612 [Thermoanaerobacterium thermosaccharolyticum]